jgi:glycosyltransferase involved in cell wall biosynthesis
MSEPAFSVVIPTYEAIDTVAATVRSVLAQTFEDFELVVVDDGSRDGTPELVEATAAGDPRLRLHRQANEGTAGARNTGVGLARGRRVSLLDNDDLWLPGFLAAVDAVFAAHPDVGLAYTDVWILDEATGRIHRRSGLEHYDPVAAYLPGPEFLSGLLRINFITACTATLRRETLAQVGGFDPTIRGSDDYDLWLRVAAAGYAAVRPEGRLALLRDRPRSQSKDRLMMARNLHQVLASARDRLPAPSPDTALVEMRLRSLDDAIHGFSGDVGGAALAFRARHRLARAKTFLSRPIELHRRVPAELLDAFPYLEELH